MPLEVQRDSQTRGTGARKARSSLLISLLVLGLTAIAVDPVSADWREGIRLLPDADLLTDFLLGPTERPPSLLEGLDLPMIVDLYEIAVNPPAPQKGLRLGPIEPYVTTTSKRTEADALDELATLRPESNRRVPQGMDVGAGLSWYFLNRVELFGEYRFLQVRPDSGSLEGHSPVGRDFDGPYLKGGFSIRY